MTANPDRASNQLDISGHQHSEDSPAVVQLRSSVRDTLARGIALVLERDRFLRRIAEIIADGCGYDRIAIYVQTAGGDEGLELGTRTAATPDNLSPRITIEINGNAPEQELEIQVEQFTQIVEEPCLTIPLIDNRVLIGLIVIFGARQESFSHEDLQALAAVGEEITPAIAVAARHAFMARNSVRDYVSGAFTWNYLQQRFEEELARCGRYGYGVSIVLIEPLDYPAFEQAVGFARADDFLRKFADGLAAVTRISDIVACRRRSRFGILLPESGVEGVHVAAARMSERIERVITTFDGFANANERLQYAFGIATYPDDGLDSVSLMLTAEQRLETARTELAHHRSEDSESRAC